MSTKKQLFAIVTFALALLASAPETASAGCGNQSYSSEVEIVSAVSVMRGRILGEGWSNITRITVRNRTCRDHWVRLECLDECGVPCDCALREGWHLVPARRQVTIEAGGRWHKRELSLEIEPPGRDPR